MRKTIPSPDPTGLDKIRLDFHRYQGAAFEKRTPPFFALELAGECGELANLEKKLWRDPSQTEHFDNLADEAADVFIALMNYCNSREIELESAVRKKLVRIEERRLAGRMGRTADESK